MEELQQGLVLMLAGMGIVFLFLVILVAVTGISMPFFAKFNGIFPEAAPKKVPKPQSEDDSAIALAIAVALKR